jgi:hypothetical protein
VFNIIHCPANLVVLGFLWFELHNPDIDWNLWRISSKSKNKNKKYIQPLILGARAFVRAVEKNVAFAIMLHLWVLQQKQVYKNFPCNIMISRMYLRRKMLTYYWNTVCMIVQLNYKMEHNLHLDQYIICRKRN